MKAEIENIIYNYADEIPHILIEGVSKVRFLAHSFFFMQLSSLF